MKRYRLYIVSTLIIILGCCLDGNSQGLNSSIVSIKKTYPIKDTIFDPVTDSVIIQVKLDDYFIWGKYPPDSIGFYSFGNNYSWTKRPVTNTTEYLAEYKCVSPAYNFTDTINPVYFWLYDVSENIDTVKSYAMIYNKPQAKLLSVYSADQVTGASEYIVYESNPRLGISAGSWFPSANVNSFITKIELKDEENAFYYTLWENAAGVPEKEITVDLPEIFTLQPGASNAFALRATGRTVTGYSGPQEFSEEYSFTLWYLHLDAPDTVCQVNRPVDLEGYPAGGSFEGNGIINNTNQFNPALAQANTFNTITYRYIISGEEFAVSKDIFVIDLPVIELEGNVEVCANSTDVLYRIENYDTSKYVYKWTFSGIKEVIDSTAISRTVHWRSDPESFTGNIKISLESKNPDQFCPAVFEYLVDIDPDVAPDKPSICYGDLDKRLLLCSNTSAIYYDWYIDDEELIWQSNTPYCYLTDDIIKYHDIDTVNHSTVFTVRIANQKTGCYTTGYMGDENTCAETMENTMQYQPARGDGTLVIDLQENPVRESMNLKLSGSFTGQYEIVVYSISGPLVHTNRNFKHAPVETLGLEFEKSLTAGIYVVICRYNAIQTAPVKMIVY
jgi:hypothetical protein